MACMVLPVLLACTFILHSAPRSLLVWCFAGWGEPLCCSNLQFGIAAPDHAGQYTYDVLSLMLAAVLPQSCRSASAQRRRRCTAEPREERAPPAPSRREGICTGRQWRRSRLQRRTAGGGRGRGGGRRLAPRWRRRGMQLGMLHCIRGATGTMQPLVAGAATHQPGLPCAEPSPPLPAEQQGLACPAIARYFEDILFRRLPALTSLLAAALVSL